MLQLYACVLLCLGRVVTGECQGEMMDYRRMLMEDFSLSPEILLNCRREIEVHCSGLHRKGRTLQCLMRVAQGGREVMEDHCMKSVSSQSCLCVNCINISILTSYLRLLRCTKHTQPCAKGKIAFKKKERNVIIFNLYGVTLKQQQFFLGTGFLEELGRKVALNVLF